MKWLKQGRILEIENVNNYIFSHAQCPIPQILREDLIRIYFSSRDNQNRSRPFFIDFDLGEKNITRRGDEKPLLDLGTSGCFDESGVMAQHVISSDDKTYLFYTGWHNRVLTPFSAAIGLAISHDGGETFNKFSQGPVLSISTIDPFFVGGHSVIVDNGIFRMWYLSCTEWKKDGDNYEPVYLIKYAESKDGIKWNAYNHVCVNYKYDGEAIARPYVIKDEKSGKYMMWYSPRSYQNFRGKNADGSYRIGYAESSDGLHWERMDEMVGIDVSSGHDWDSEMVAYASVANLNSKYVMLYNGNGFGKSGFGYAISKKN
jgi:hypothetical protein